MVASALHVAQLTLNRSLASAKYITCDRVDDHFACLASSKDNGAAREDIADEVKGIGPVHANTGDCVFDGGVLTGERYA